MLATISTLALLLLAPGPTNTLLLRAGALHGFKRSWRLAFIECAAYLLQVSIWGWVVVALANHSSWTLKGLQLAASCYLLYVASRLWRRPTTDSTVDNDRVGSLHFFWMTMMNPKGLLIVSFIAPLDAFVRWEGYIAFLGTLAGVVIATGLLWIGLGGRLETLKTSWLTPLKINRGTSVVIAFFASVLMGRLALSVLS